LDRKGGHARGEGDQGDRATDLLNIFLSRHPSSSSLLCDSLLTTMCRPQVTPPPLGPGPRQRRRSSATAAPPHKRRRPASPPPTVFSPRPPPGGAVAGPAASSPPAVSPIAGTACRGRACWVDSAGRPVDWQVLLLCCFTENLTSP
jgi:hypothetical protein